MQPNIVDFIIVGVLLLFTLEAVGRPLVLELLDLVSFLLAGILSFSYYNLPAKLLEDYPTFPHGLALVLGFMIVWFLSEIIFYAVVRILLPRIPKFKIPGSRILSIIPALLKGLIFVAITLVIIATFPIAPAVKKAVINSKLGSQILNQSYSLEQPVKNVFGGVANDSLTFLTIKPKTDERVNLGFQTDQISVDETSENTMVNLVNKERISRGLNALSFDKDLRIIARDHSVDMLKRGYFSHYSPEGLTVAERAEKAGISYLVIGENLAYAPSVELAHQGLMNSEGHKANILSTDFNKIGIGVVDGGIYGKMFTQVFTN